MAWYQVPNNGLMGRVARFVGAEEYPDEEEAVETVAVDCFLELRAYTDRWNTSYYVHDRRNPYDETFVQRGGDREDAIREFRRMLREGEL